MKSKTGQNLNDLCLEKIQSTLIIKHLLGRKQMVWSQYVSKSRIYEIYIIWIRLCPPLVPTDLSLEKSHEVSSLTTPSLVNNLDTSAGYVLPLKNNRRKPPNKYSSDIEGKKSRYPIANYASTQKLLEPLNGLCILYPHTIFHME